MGLPVCCCTASVGGPGHGRSRARGPSRRGAARVRPPPSGRGWCPRRVAQPGGCSTRPRTARPVDHRMGADAPCRRGARTGLPCPLGPGNQNRTVTRLGLLDSLRTVIRATRTQGIDCRTLPDTAPTGPQSSLSPVPGKARELLKPRGPHPGARPGTCGGNQPSPGGPDGGSRHSSSSGRTLCPETVSGNPKPSGPPPGQRVGGRRWPVARRGRTRIIRRQRASRAAPGLGGSHCRLNPHRTRTQ
jgi:hypothetical protein